MPDTVPEPYEVDRPVGGPSGVASDALLRVDVFERSQQAVRDTNLQEVIALLDDQSVKVSVQGPMLFDLGRAELKTDMRAFLGRLAEIISETPYVVHIVGHTDDQPINTSRFQAIGNSTRSGKPSGRFLIESGNLTQYAFVVMGRAIRSYAQLRRGTCAQSAR